MLFLADYTEFFRTFVSPSLALFWVLAPRFGMNLGILLLTNDFFAFEPVRGSDFFFCRAAFI